MTINRITPDMIEANIIGEHYFTARDGAYNVMNDCEITGDLNPSRGSSVGLGLLTFCVLTLKNGFMVTGESACADPATFDAEIGRKVARQNAINKIWPVMGYALRSRLTGTDGLGY